MAKSPPRLVDLHADWLWQYAPETDLYPPDVAARARDAIPQSEGYLGAVAATLVAVRRSADDWDARPDRWGALGDLIARIEAEFPGRLLLAPDDFARWRDDPDGLSWAAISLDGCDGLIREAQDLDRLPGLFTRGVRVFRPVAGGSGRLGGSWGEGDDRGLTDLGRAMLDALSAIGADGPRPIVDLAGMNAATMADVLSWIEAEPARADRVLATHSRGAVAREGIARPRAIPPEALARMRASGVVIGLAVSPPYVDSAEALREAIETAATIPFLGRAGYAGIGMASGFPGRSATVPGLGSAPEIVAWAARSFGAEAAHAILRGTGEALLAGAAGGA